MIYTIDQLALSTEVANLERMIPIFIGKSKTLITETPTFIDIAYTLIQITLNNNYIIDEDSIVPTIIYWKSLTSEISITNNSSTTLDVTLNYATTEKFNQNSLFVVYDIDTSILFSSTIESFIYSTDSLVSITLTNELSVTGDLKCKIITKTTDIIPYTYDNASKQIQLIFTDQFTSISLNPIINGSSLSYSVIPNSCQLVIYQNITQTDIDNEANDHIAIGLKNSKSAIIISIPNDSYINEALDKISSYRIGYYIVPIELSDTSINAIVQYCKTDRTNDFYSAIVPSTLVTTSAIISNASVTK